MWLSLSHFQQWLFLLKFPLNDVVITTEAMPSHWAFYFLGSVLLLSFGGNWSDSVCDIHITFQELQVVALMLHRMAFSSFGKVLLTAG